MTSFRRICTCVVIAAALASCGGSGASTPATRAASLGRVVVRVANHSITTATLARWMSILASEHFVPDPPRYRACITHLELLEPGSVTAELEEECRHDYQALKQQALAFLISRYWLIGEAADEGLRAGSEEVAQMLTRGKAVLYEGGDATRADEQLAVEAQLASTKIQGALITREAQITRAEIAAYYHRHIARYEHRELRDILIDEHIVSRAAAVRARREVVSGNKRMEDISLAEAVQEAHPVNSVPGKLALARAIFTARPHILSALLMFDRQPAFFEVTHITPAYVQPLVQVSASIRAQVAAEQHRRSLAAFVAAWRRRWSAKTSCEPGYLVQKCAGYRGPRVPEGPPALS